MSFEQLNLLPQLVRAVREKGYTAPTPIQSQAIPPALEGRDVLGCAQTGTGKTAAFALPILQRLWKSDAPGHAAPRGAVRPVLALVLAPTRELASQIGASFDAYGKHSGLRTSVIFGGVGYPKQRDELRRGVDIVVATPGRLLDLMRERSVRFDSLQVLVLDEADRMLDMGFLPDVKRVLAGVPKKRQTLFFSATMPREIQGLVDSLLHDPARVAVAPVATTAEKVEQAVFHVTRDQKLDVLTALLNGEEVTRALVFTRTKRGADKVAKRLASSGLRAEAIHGNKSQNARERALKGFQTRPGAVLVATDIAARGIDVRDISHVINFELPNEPETYVHRIGRTARAAAAGTAWSLCSNDEREFLRDIEKLIRQRIPVAQLPAGGGKVTVSAAEPEHERAPRGGRGRPAARAHVPAARHSPAHERATHMDATRASKAPAAAHASAAGFGAGVEHGAAAEPAHAARTPRVPEIATKFKNTRTNAQLALKKQQAEERRGTHDRYADSRGGAHAPRTHAPSGHLVRRGAGHGPARGASHGPARGAPPQRAAAHRDGDHRDAPHRDAGHRDAPRREAPRQDAPKRAAPHAHAPRRGPASHGPSNRGPERRSQR